MKKNKNEKNKKAVFTVNPKIYPLEVIYDACYYFLDNFYIYLDGDPKKEIKVYLKEKKGAVNKHKNFKGEFLNYLLHASLRYEISRKNQKIREYFVAAALAPFDQKEKCFSEDNKEWMEDPLGIAIPWEEKHEGKKKKAKNK